MSGAGLQVILTHEHTDFDALASMLGAALLFPDALPVLPRQLNRNVRDFLTLYHSHFPFITDRDLPRQRVARAILVDAHAVNWVKGMDHEVEFLIIDHHSQEAEQTASVWSGPVGANTTLLVERLCEIDFPLSSVQTTLLALGIHEDTGSLTYPSTSQRDAACLAWLMEAGHKVNLDVVNQFLNHPLSATQRALFQQLIDHSEFIEIAGHTIVIARADAPGFTEALSSLASRLRDFHETDAIFVVIHVGDIIQVVARSTTDEVDVGKVASALGGGGHTRAAAAPVHGSAHDLRAVRDRIVELVEKHSRAAFTVRNIMSTGRPQVLTPEMRIIEAAELMRRYGHEGFPVLRRHADGREEIIGVLTRREADRALSHELGDQPVSRFMRAGNVAVRPDDPVTTLRKLMIDHNWGQIPVVDDDGRIIGIVTRTDLIKLWDEASLPRRGADRMAQRLQASLAPSQHALLHRIGEVVDSLKYTVYIVGGFVRDLLLSTNHADLRNLDIDIVIEGNAIDVAEQMQARYGGRVVPHRRFGTAKWLLRDAEHPVDWLSLLGGLAESDSRRELPAHLDFVTARTEFYAAPTVLPTVENSSIKLDLHRRDFTINTLALCLNPDRWGELLDFYGGVNDLNHGLIRVLHSLSFLDDPTRILRGVRYEQRFDFQIEPRTLELLQDARELLDRVSPARLRHELERILQEDFPERALQRLNDLGVLAHIDRELFADGWTQRKFSHFRAARRQAAAPDPLRTEPIERLYWGLFVFRLAPDAHPRLAERLGLRGETQRMTRGIGALHEHEGELRRADLQPSRVVAIFDRVEPVALAVAGVAWADDPQILHWLERYAQSWQAVRPELDGHALAALGAPRGRLYGEILGALRAARLDGQVATRDDEIALAQQMIERALQPTGRQDD